MRVKKKFYSINALAKKWTFNVVDVKNLIRSGELKASIIHDDGNLVTYDKFIEIPDDIRPHLNVIKSNQGIPNKFNKSSRAWNQLIITADEVIRYESYNKEEDTSTVRKSECNEENKKSTNSLLKMIAVMATNCYNYDRTANKSKVPAELVADADIMGIKINEKTVRDWLKKAFDDIDQNKPEDI